MDTRFLYTILVGLVACERLYELRLTRKHRTLLLLRGGRDGESLWQYRAMVAFHTAFLVSCPLEVYLLERPFRAGLAVVAGFVLAAAMALRYWAVRTLGERWMTRVMVVPGEPPVTGGPYRFVRHPNYTAVVLEVASLPLLHSAWLVALVATLLNAVLLFFRIRSEEAALLSLPGYERLFAGRGRLLPRPRVHRP